MIKKPTVCIYGDSLMKATVLDKNRRYRSTIKGFLETLSASYGTVFKNKAHFGLTVEHGHRLLKKDMENGASYDYALIEFGGNDCSFDWQAVAARPDEDHKPFTGLETFTENLTAMTDELKKNGITPILMTLPPIDATRHYNFIGKTREERNNILKWLGDRQMIYRFHELYSNTVAEIARQTKTILVDVRRRFLELHNLKDLICSDGVHLTGRGYGFIVKIFGDFIVQHRQRPEILVFA